MQEDRDFDSGAESDDAHTGNPPKRSAGAAEAPGKARKRGATLVKQHKSPPDTNAQSELELLMMDDHALRAARDGARDHALTAVATGASTEDGQKRAKLSRKQRLAQKKAERKGAKQRRGSDDEEFVADLQDPRFAVRPRTPCTVHGARRTTASQTSRHGSA